MSGRDWYVPGYKKYLLSLIGLLGLAWWCMPWLVGKNEKHQLWYHLAARINNEAVLSQIGQKPFEKVIMPTNEGFSAIKDHTSETCLDALSAIGRFSLGEYPLNKRSQVTQ
jgi:hypothetical protein